MELIALSINFKLLILILLLLNLIGGWIAFKKAGKYGVEILIPIYNLYVFSEIAKKERYGQFLIGAVILSQIIILPEIMSITLAILSLYSLFIINYNFAKKYINNKWFAIGFVILPFILLPIIGLNKNIKYYNCKS